MSDILTQKQENFITDVFQDVKPSLAYFNHYNCKSLNVASAAATRLLKVVKVQARLHQLRSQLAERAISDKVMPELERKEVLSEIARARFGDFANKDGHLDISGKDKLNNAALAELKTTKWEGGKEGRAKSLTTTIKLRDPIAAIKELNLMDGVYELEKRNVYNDIKVLVVREELKQLPSPDIVERGK